MTKLICIVCPKGCHLEVDDNLNVKGNSCKRGEVYGKNEVTNPTRTITSTVILKNSSLTRLPVKTSDPVPKSKIFDVMKEINKIEVSAPVNSGDVLIENVLNIGSNIIACKSVK